MRQETKGAPNCTHVRTWKNVEDNKGRKKQNKINVKRGKTINGREVPGDRCDN